MLEKINLGGRAKDLWAKNLYPQLQQLYYKMRCTDHVLKQRSS